MPSFKMKPISHDEYLSGKYKDVSTTSGKHEAKVWYKDNGSIDEDYTYSDSYLRSNGLGRYAKKAESSSKSSSSKSSSSKSSGGSSSSLFGSGSKNKSSKAEEKVEEKTVYVTVKVPATDEERLEYLYYRLCYNGDFNELKINALIAKAQSLGLDATELIERMEKRMRHLSDYKYAEEIGKDARGAYPPIEREELMEYIKYINKENRGRWWTETLINLDLVVRKHYEMDTELRSIVDDLKKNSDYYQENSPLGCPPPKVKKNIIKDLMNLGKTYKN